MWKKTLIYKKYHSCKQKWISKSSIHGNGKQKSRCNRLPQWENQVPLHSKTRLYMISKTSLVSAVVAQPGRALDLFRVKLKTELSWAQISPTALHMCFTVFLIMMEMLSIILQDAARWFLASNMAVNSCFDRCLEIFMSLLAASKKCSPLSTAENATLCMSR